MISSRRLLLLMIAVLAAGPAWAADKDGKAKPRRIIVQPVKPAADVGLRPSLPVGPPPALALPPLMQPGAAFTAGSLASGGLAAGGLRSTLPGLGDGGGQCRTRCTQTRVICDSQEAGPECAPRWSTCIADCAR